MAIVGEVNKLCMSLFYTIYITGKDQGAKTFIDRLMDDIRITNEELGRVIDDTKVEKRLSEV